MSKKKTGVECPTCHRPMKIKKRTVKSAEMASFLPKAAGPETADARLARLEQDRYSHIPWIAVAAQDEYNRLKFGTGGGVR